MFNTTRSARPSVAARRTGFRFLVTGMLVALLSAFALSAWAAPHPGGMGYPWMGRMMERALDAVSATDQQRSQIRQIAEAATADLKAQREAGKALREQALQLFTQPSVDANAAEALRGQMMAQHDQSSRRMMQAMLDVSRVLSPEQRVKLAELMQQRRDAMQRRWRERGEPTTPRS